MNTGYSSVRRRVLVAGLKIFFCLLIVAIVASISIPGLLRCRVSAEHARLIGDLRARAAEHARPLPLPPVMNTERYAPIHDNPFADAGQRPLSTFAIDVDTASYANVRRFLRNGVAPPKDAVRIEEMVNYFPKGYPEPAGEDPFSITTEVAACPWQPEHRLVLIGLQGRHVAEGPRARRHMVFLIDVSGSMESPDKLPLLKDALGLLVDDLRYNDRIAIVVYAGNAGLVLPPTDGTRKDQIRAAIEHLEAGGSTAGGEGILLAYEMARQMYDKDAVNRVILATDGDFNVGITSPGDLERLIEKERESGVMLSVLGLGEGNLQDETMELLADKGNGNYSYLDSLAEAKKVLVREAAGTLVTIAKDVKVQVEFNPRLVSSYRLIGYEDRLMAEEDFSDDRKDGGEVGAGHSVTALYEVVPGSASPAGSLPLRYRNERPLSAMAQADELLNVQTRYQPPSGGASRLITTVIRVPDEARPPSNDMRFAAAVAGFGMLLRDSEHKGRFDYQDVLVLAQTARGPDPFGYRAEFIDLVAQAARLPRG